MKPLSIKKVFGIISYFPNNDSDYHIETRRERSRRFKELLFKLEELWPDIDIMIIAQNWQDFELPKIKNKITIFPHKNKLGILGARKELRKQFLASDYDYLIMLDDDGRILNADPEKYIKEIDNHPSGIGVIRHRMCPLMFLAISKDIYSQIDMPDIRAEKGEGFEDDVFVAQCFSQFPDLAFDFSKDCIEEFSLKYNGPGKCPSTWAKESKLDWDYMRSHTNNLLYEIAHQNDETPEETNPTNIDAVVTYVNCSDTTWQREYIKTTKTHNPSGVRFRSWGTLKYLFRSIAQNMPFIRNIILIVSGPSQVPVWINKSNVRVVYHKDFIPEKLLPTFNSCTIESFFWNIPDLSDRIIYFNDDIFPMNRTKESDFFSGNIPHLEFLFYEKYNKKAIFRAQCRSGADMIADVLGKERYQINGLFLPEHSAIPIAKESLLAVGKLCGDILESKASKLRLPTNVNQYIYAYYSYYMNNYIDTKYNFRYMELLDKNMKNVTEEIMNGHHSIICLNDSDKIKDYKRVRYLLQECLNKKFSKPCKYEI